MTDLTHFTLLQVVPYKNPGQGTFEESGGDSFPLPGVVCRHCMKKSKGRKFFTTSAEHLGDLLLTISDHMAICKDCPDNIKSQNTTFKATHESQLQQLGEGVHDGCMKRVWSRLLALNKPPAPVAKSAAPALKRDPIEYNTVDPTTQIVLASDVSLVTPFTYFTMQQVLPCNLDNSGNGSRSAFDWNFPGTYVTLIACVVHVFSVFFSLCLPIKYM